MSLLIIAGLLRGSKVPSRTLINQMLSVSPSFPMQRYCFYGSDTISMWASAQTEDLGGQRCNIVKDDTVVLAFDGRLDNREELRAILGREVSCSLSDSELVMLGYKSWGKDFVRYLDGDFGISLWDNSLTTLFLIRDRTGARPLFWCFHGETVVWSSNIIGLLPFVNSIDDIDQDFLENYIRALSTGTRTAYRTIKPVPPGECLQFERGETHTSRYWDPSCFHEAKHNSDAEYEESFRDVFKRSLVARVESTSEITAELSGGVDSSSIVCYSDHLLKLGATSKELATISCIYPSHTESNEIDFIREVENFRSKGGVHLNEDSAEVLDLSGIQAFEGPNTHRCFQLLQARLASTMRSHGSHVLLSGMGGDQVTWGEVNTPVVLADLLVRRQWRPLLQQTHSWAHILQRPYLNVFWHAAVLPTHYGYTDRFRLPYWLENAPLTRRKYKAIDPVPLPNDMEPSKRYLWGHISRLINSIAEGYGTYFYTAKGIDVRFPFLSKQMIEFAMAIPSEQLLRPGHTRSLLRRAMKGILPEQIRRRRTKAGPSQAILKRFVQQYAFFRRFLLNGQCVARGVVDAEDLERELHRIRAGICSHIPSLLRLLAVELWLRTIVNGRLASVSMHFYLCDTCNMNRSANQAEKGGDYEWIMK